MQRQGLYPGAPRIPYVMGYECSGVVEAIGEGVTEFEASHIKIISKLHFQFNSQHTIIPLFS